MPLTRFLDVLQKTDLTVCRGKVDRIVGLAVESLGPPVKIGEICRIYPPGGAGD